MFNGLCVLKVNKLEPSWCSRGSFVSMPIKGAAAGVDTDLSGV